MFVKIKGFDNYLINEQGQVYSKVSDKFIANYRNKTGTLYVTLHKSGKNCSFSVAKLVLDHFQPSKTKIKVCAYHKDLELENVQNENLERCSRSDRLRMLNEMNKKIRGVYAYNNPASKKKFRVVIKDKQGRTKTIGYYKTKFFATFQYVKAYTQMFGRSPY